MKNYNRIMLGAKSKFAEEGFAGNYVGANFEIDHDLTPNLKGDLRAFNAVNVPNYLENHPGKSKVAAGLACGALWTIAKGLQPGDIVLSPDGNGRYHIGEISGSYVFAPGANLPHRRGVTWFAPTIDRSDMSEALKNSTGSVGTVSNISSHAAEIDSFLKSAPAPALVDADETVENPYVFAMEKHLEDFLVKNWASTEIGQTHDIWHDDGEMTGRQYPTDTGAIDILAVSKDQKQFLVVELKRGRASDVVVGQILRYMGYVQDELAEKDQTVRGAIIALEDDVRIKRALRMTPTIGFLRYQIGFKLLKA
jgi:restriction system protein